MRLLDTTSLEFLEFEGDNIPGYAILSHRWGSPQVEVSHKEYQKGLKQQTAGYSKIQALCLKARSEGIKYAWLDTCCIDKRSSAELSEAINSMFKWYRDALKCYAYLDDIDDGDDWTRSRWWQRGWTLQELIAPEMVEFYNKHWRKIGTKIELAPRIEALTSIPESVLTYPDDYRYWSVAQKMSWASGRKTTRVEDRAYSLLGIFSINMPLLYGEGAKAFERLQLEIIRKFLDESIFAWTTQHATPQSVLATSPDDFSTCANMCPDLDSVVGMANEQYFQRDTPLQVTSWGIEIVAPLQKLELLRPVVVAGKEVTDMRVMRLTAAWAGEIRPLPCALLLVPAGPAPGIYRRLRCIHGEVWDKLGRWGRFEHIKPPKKLYLSFDRDFHHE